MVPATNNRSDPQCVRITPADVVAQTSLYDDRKCSQVHLAIMPYCEYEFTCRGQSAREAFIHPHFRMTLENVGEYMLT